MANKSKSKTKIYFWLKLDENFYKNIVIKKARKSPGGDTMVIIYQRLMLQSLPTDGILYYEGALENLAEELSLSLDEEVEKIQMTLAFFTKFGLVQIDENDNADMLQVHALVDQETDWARYKRASRKNKTGQSPANLDNVQPLSKVCPTELEIEIEKELELEKELEKKQDIDQEFEEYISLFIDFAIKNKNNRAMAQVLFLDLPPFQRQEALIGAKHYIEWYRSYKPEDTTGQFSINAEKFLNDLVFTEWQEKPKPKAYNVFEDHSNTDINDRGGW